MCFRVDFSVGELPTVRTVYKVYRRSKGRRNKPSSLVLASPIYGDTNIKLFVHHKIKGRRYNFSEENGLSEVGIYVFLDLEHAINYKNRQKNAYDFNKNLIVVQCVVDPKDFLCLSIGREQATYRKVLPVAVVA